tara:strand:- start:324 stop:746 length:423 start_codon:yes stop_codon:yes gene_type:complete
MADTGNGATLTLGTQGGSYDIVSITGLEVTKEVIEVTKLADTGRKRFIANDLAEIGEITVTAYSDCGVPNIAYDYGADIDESVTITYPQAPGGSTGGTVVFGGRPVSVKSADAENGEVMLVEFTLKGTGNSAGFTFTSGS